MSVSIRFAGVLGLDGHRSNYSNRKDIMNQPQIGEAVFYCLDNGNNVGDVRPAIIVRVWPDAQAVNLAVFTDFANDNLPTPYWATSRVQGTGPGHWANTAEGLVAPPAPEVPLVPLVETVEPSPVLAQPAVAVEPAPAPKPVAPAPAAPPVDRPKLRRLPRPLQPRKPRTKRLLQPMPRPLRPRLMPRRRRRALWPRSRRKGP